jgi:hypothetical protein
MDLADNDLLDLLLARKASRRASPIDPKCTRCWP